MRLENWSLCDFGTDPYMAPEGRSKGLHGYVYDSDKFEDGACVTTSRIILVADGVVTTRSGSQYVLGKPHPEYEKTYPNAYNRLFRWAEVPQ